MSMKKEDCFYRIVDTKCPLVLNYVPDVEKAYEILENLYKKGRRNIALTDTFGAVIKEY